MSIFNAAYEFNKCVLNASINSKFGVLEYYFFLSFHNYKVILATSLFN